MTKRVSLTTTRSGLAFGGDGGGGGVTAGGVGDRAVGAGAGPGGAGGGTVAQPATATMASRSRQPPNGALPHILAMGAASRLRLGVGVCWLRALLNRVGHVVEGPI